MACKEFLSSPIFVLGKTQQLSQNFLSKKKALKESYGQFATLQQEETKAGDHYAAAVQGSSEALRNMEDCFGKNVHLPVLRNMVVVVESYSHEKDIEDCQSETNDFYETLAEVREAKIHKEQKEKNVSALKEKLEMLQNQKEASRLSSLAAKKDMHKVCSQYLHGGSSAPVSEDL